MRSNEPLESERPLVGKFGGTSAARPDVVIGHIIEQGPGIFVTSAAGSDEGQGRDARMTEMLRAHAANPSTESLMAIKERFAEIAVRAGAAPEAIKTLVAQIGSDFKSWNKAAWEGLGEHWSSQTIAAGLEERGENVKWIDAAEMIRFSSPNRLMRLLGKKAMIDYESTEKAIQTRLAKVAVGTTVIVGGFYGVDKNGTRQTMESGGSDLTGALIAKVVNAREYQNWSDVDGYQSADPRHFSDARQIPYITYDEKRELGNGGNGLLHKEVSKILGGHDIPTRMMNTFGDGTKSTLITDKRDSGEMPIVGVTLQKMTKLRLPAKDNKPGQTLRYLKKLKKAKIPYEHSTTAPDTEVLLVNAEYGDRAADVLRKHLLGSEPVDVVHIVGEGLSGKNPQINKSLSYIQRKFAESDVGHEGATDTGKEPSFTKFVPIGQGERAVSALIEEIAT